MGDREQPVTGIAWTPKLRERAERRQIELDIIPGAPGEQTRVGRPIVKPDDPSWLTIKFQQALHLPTRGMFARRFLHGIGAPITDHTLAAMMAWMQAEGDAGRYNPLNTTQDEPGATVFNWVGVKNYVSWEQGVKATVKTLSFGANHEQFGYQPIRAHLRNSDQPLTVMEAVERSAWGTGGLARRVLEETGEHALLTNRYLHHRLSH
jgi:hypothetical protein